MPLDFGVGKNKLGRRATKSDCIAKLCFVFFSYVLIFSFGIFFGKWVTDNQNKVASYATCETSHDTVVSFQEALKTQLGRKTAAADDLERNLIKPPPAAVPLASVAPAAPTMTQVQAASSAPPLPQAVPPEIPRQKAKSKAAEDSLAMPVDYHGSFTVKISSFPSKQAALVKVKELKVKDLEAFYFPDKIPGKGNRFRVCVGAFGTFKAAQNYRDLAVAKRRLPPESIVHKIQ